MKRLVVNNCISILKMAETKSELQKMIDGELYCKYDKELRSKHINARKLCHQYNNTEPDDYELREKILHDLFPNAGKGLEMTEPIHCDYGFNCYFGENVFFNCYSAILDVCPVHVGSRTLFGPYCGIFTASHPNDFSIRATELEFGKPITIGEDCFVGGRVSFVPGVKVGDRVVIGTGSVVCKDIPSDCIAVGNPCKVIKSLNNPDERNAAAKQYAN